jgi:hypothetical protein
MISWGIEPATFQLLALGLNQLRHCVPQFLLIVQDTNALLGAIHNFLVLKQL